MQRSGSLALAVVAGLFWMCCGIAQGNDDGSRQALERGRPPASDFLLKLELDNGHVGELYVGCKPDATDGYDRKLDDFAPPPGIGGVAYTFLVPADRKMNLYRDVRAPATAEKPTQWLLFARLDKEPVTVSWNPATLPTGIRLYCMKWDGKSTEPGESLDMAKVTSVKLDKTGYLRIWTSLPTEKDGAER